MITIRWFLLGLLAAAVAVTLFLQRETTANLRDEIALLREDQRELVRLRAERDRLTAEQPPKAEMERLRSDRAALNQLRAEIEAMKARVVQAERGEFPGPDEPDRSAATLTFAVAADGTLGAEGSSLDAGALRQQLSRFARGTALEIRLQLDAKSRIDDVKAKVDQLIALEKELGLKLHLRFEQRPPSSQ